MGVFEHPEHRWIDATGSGDGTGSFKVKIRTKTAKFTNMIIARFRDSRFVKVSYSSKIKPRLRAE